MKGRGEEFGGESVAASFIVINSIICLGHILQMRKSQHRGVLPKSCFPGAFSSHPFASVFDLLTSQGPAFLIERKWPDPGHGSETQTSTGSEGKEKQGEWAEWRGRRKDRSPEEATVSFGHLQGTRGLEPLRSQADLEDWAWGRIIQLFQF